MCRRGFEAHELTGLQAARLLGALIDGLLRALHDYTVETVIPGTPEPFAMVGTGGYGRGVVAPFSDIDLLFLTAAEPGPRVLQAVEFMLYLLWDLGLKVGHATRSIAECAAEAAADTTVRTSLIDARLIAGSAALYAEFQARYGAACEAAGFAGFIAAKQAERDARHRRFGDSPFLVEPNVKEGRGGLRDLQTLYWLSRYVFGTLVMGDLVGPHSPGGGLLTAHEARLARRCWSFLWTVRFHLHYVAGRAEERLTFDLQPVVGARMGYTRHGRQDGVERFMRHYFLTAREITRVTRVLEPAIVRAALGPPALAAETDPALLRAGFVLADGKLLGSPARDFRDEPLQMLRLLQVARDRDLALHPLALRALIRNVRGAMSLRGDPQAAALFLDLLCGRDAEHMRSDGAKWLSILNETGFLGRFIPDWARIVGQMQFDTYHVFTVDEHTIEAVRVLNALERGELTDVAPVSSGLVEDLQSRRALYVAMLLHDIAKGRGGDHSEIGAELALDVGPVLGLAAEETETVSWLVLHHLLLSQTAFHRDIDDPKTILDIADTIQSPERLKLLLILTVADMRAVSPKVWNGWKATLLRELYSRVAEVLAGGLATTERDTRVARAREAAAELLPDWDQAARERFFALGYPSVLARLRSRNARPPCPPDARRGGAGRAADRRYRSAAGTRGDRGDGLYRRSCRAVQPHRGRARGRRRLDRRCAHPHHDQRHGARHVLDPGRRRWRVRRPAPAGSALCAGRAGADRAAAAGSRDPPRLQGAARQPDARDPRAAARRAGQPRVQHPHRDRGQRARPSRAAARCHRRDLRTGVADRLGPRHHLRRAGG